MLSSFNPRHSVLLVAYTLLVACLCWILDKSWLLEAFLISTYPMWCGFASTDWAQPFIHKVGPSGFWQCVSLILGIVVGVLIDILVIIAIIVLPIYGFYKLHLWADAGGNWIRKNETQ